MLMNRILLLGKNEGTGSSRKIRDMIGRWFVVSTIGALKSTSVPGE